MKIANLTFSLHGIAPHWAQFRKWLETRGPDIDIVTLQKIGPRKDFPREALRDLGYESSCLPKCSRSDLGVAILSRKNQGKVPAPVLPGVEEESRFLTVDIDGLWVSSVYAPYGNPQKWGKAAIDRRVTWLERLRNHVHRENYASRDSVLCGDFNVKLDEKLGTKGNYTRREQCALDKLCELGFHDLYRVQHPRSRGFTFGFTADKPDEGNSRLHLALGSESVAKRLRSVCVDVKHKHRDEAAPLIVELEDPGA